MKEVLSKVFNEKMFVIEAPQTANSQTTLDTGIAKFMRRLVVFDLIYLKELKQDTFRSDFDELQFTIALILDVTRTVADKDPTLSMISSDTIKMQKAFLKLRNKIGIVVPFARSVDAFKKLFDDGFKNKLGITNLEDEVFVGTPDMFRGVEKDIVILSMVRNSTVDGLGQLDDDGLVRLALTRAKQFLWVVSASITFLG